MGYYVNGRGEISIKKERMEELYKAFVAMNDFSDEVKNGGSWSSGEKESSNFSWMPSDLSTLGNAITIINHLGFETSEDSTHFVIISYEGKIGQEDIFFAVAAPFVDDGGWFEWEGEDHSFWSWSFDGGRLLQADGIREYGEPFEVTVNDLIDESARQRKRVAEMLSVSRKDSLEENQGGTSS